ncbi:MAG: sigma-70 family RNA polymerase sigma factor [Anaerolineaceae bacterium]|nr:sigma-70 family RNA polymerase sigma factor [Anaerolineaceae bacterium]
MSTFIQPTREQIDAFRDGDPVAIDEVVTIVLPQIYRWAVSKYQNLPPQEVQSVVNQVIAEICRNCNRYDPDQALFTTYAIYLIEKRIVDVWEKEKKIINLESVDLELHENRASGAYKDIEEQITIDSLFDTVSSQLDDLERDFLKLMREGEIRLEVFAATLQHYRIVDKPEREINTIKERIKRRLKSAAHHMGLDQDLF